MLYGYWQAKWHPKNKPCILAAEAGNMLVAVKWTIFQIRCRKGIFFHLLSRSQSGHHYVLAIPPHPLYYFSLINLWLYYVKDHFIMPHDLGHAHMNKRRSLLIMIRPWNAVTKFACVQYDGQKSHSLASNDQVIHQRFNFFLQILPLCKLLLLAKLKSNILGLF